MQTIAVIAVSLAALGFCLMHIIKRIYDWKQYERRLTEYEQVKKELENEIRNGGNLSRIAALRERMRELKVLLD